MNLIVMHDGPGRRPTTFSGGRLVQVAILAFFLVPLAVGSGLFWLHAWHARRSKAGLSVAVRRETARVQVLRANTHRELVGLARQIGVLAAQASRLELTENRLGRLAGLPAASFPKSAIPLMRAVQTQSPSPDISLSTLQGLVGQLKRKLSRGQVEVAALTQLLAARAVRLMTTPKGWPVRGGWISSPFGPRPDPFTGRPGFHPGVDIAVPIGTPVRAMAAGVVIWAHKDGGFGRLVKVFIGHGEVTYYAHLSAVFVHVGEVVHKRTLIGRVGDTGYSTGPHLHFEVTMNGMPINPIHFLDYADRH